MSTPIFFSPEECQEVSDVFVSMWHAERVGKGMRPRGSIEEFKKWMQDWLEYGQQLAELRTRFDLSPFQEEGQ